MAYFGTRYCVFKSHLKFYAMAKRSDDRDIGHGLGQQIAAAKSSLQVAGNKKTLQRVLLVAYPGLEPGTP